VLTKDNVFELLQTRSVLWLDASVEIANHFPNTWEAIEDYLARTRSMLNLRLTNLLFDAVRESFEYSVIEHGHTVEVKLSIPLSVILESQEKGPEPVVLFLDNNPPVSVLDLSGSLAENERRRQIEHSLKQTQEMYPDMYMDISRMVELEDSFLNGEVFRGMATETKQ
jgi:hypothetical protein